MRRTLLSDFADSPAVIDAEFCAGDPEARERVEKFVAEKIVENSEIEGDVYLELAQLGGGSTSVIESWLFSQGDDPNVVADAIVDRAMEDGGATARGKTGYQVTIKGHRGRCAFSLEYTPRDDDDPNEAPNEKGLVAQAMRHMEKLMSSSFNMIEKSQRRQDEQAKEILAENRSLRGQQIETIQTLASLYDAKHVREIEAKKMDKAEARKDEVAGFLMQGVPHIINKLAGKAVVQAESTPLEQMLHGLLSTFTQEQLMKMTTTGTLELRQDQRMGVLGLFQALQDRLDAKNQAQAAHTNGVTPGAGAAQASTPPATGG